MKKKLSPFGFHVKHNINIYVFQTRPARLMNSRAIMVTAFKRNGYVTTKMTVEMVAMNKSARKISVTPKMTLLVEMDTALLKDGGVTVIWTVPMLRMKW